MIIETFLIKYLFIPISRTRNVDQELSFCLCCDMNNQNTNEERSPRDLSYFGSLNSIQIYVTKYRCNFQASQS